MTYPGSGYSSTFSRGQPPLEGVAAEVLAAARGQLPSQQAIPPRPLSAEEKAEAERAAQEKRFCMYCSGLHAMPSSTACPRLASFELDGDREIKAGTFWPGLEWSKGRVLFPEDIAEEEAPDGGQ